LSFFCIEKGTVSETPNLMQTLGRNQISVQVSGFRIWGLLTPGT
jgi:hypothetical protein